MRLDIARWCLPLHLYYFSVGRCPVRGEKLEMTEVQFEVILTVIRFLHVRKTLFKVEITGALLGSMVVVMVHISCVSAPPYHALAFFLFKRDLHVPEGETGLFSCSTGHKYCRSRNRVQHILVHSGGRTETGSGGFLEMM